MLWVAYTDLSMELSLCNHQYLFLAIWCPTENWLQYFKIYKRFGYKIVDKFAL